MYTFSGGAAKHTCSLKLSRNSQRYQRGAQGLRIKDTFVMEIHIGARGTFPGPHVAVGHNIGKPLQKIRKTLPRKPGPIESQKLENTSQSIKNTGCPCVSSTLAPLCFVIRWARVFVRGWKKTPRCPYIVANIDIINNTASGRSRQVNAFVHYFI